MRRLWLRWRVRPGRCQGRRRGPPRSRRTRSTRPRGGLPEGSGASGSCAARTAWSWPGPGTPLRWARPRRGRRSSCPRSMSGETGLARGWPNRWPPWAGPRRARVSSGLRTPSELVFLLVLRDLHAAEPLVELPRPRVVLLHTNVEGNASRLRLRLKVLDDRGTDPAALNVGQQLNAGPAPWSPPGQRRRGT